MDLSLCFPLIFHRSRKCTRSISSGIRLALYVVYMYVRPRDHVRNFRLAKPALSSRLIYPRRPRVPSAARRGATATPASGACRAQLITGKLVPGISRRGRRRIFRARGRKLRNTGDAWSISRGSWPTSLWGVGEVHSRANNNFCRERERATGRQSFSRLKSREMRAELFRVMPAARKTD